MPFEPIAIVGRACVLPGALSPQAFWRAIRDGRDLTGPVPNGFWRLDPARVLADKGERAACDRGGYVTGFEAVFDPDRYGIPSETLSALDPLFHWLLHVAGESLRDAGLNGGTMERTGLVAGNLSYPSHSLNRYAEAVWLENQGIEFLDGRASELAGLDLPTPLNRFMSGHPAHLAATALGLGGEAFCVDAACASSLYAIKAACDRLHDRTADVMVAGAVNRADDLFLHVGFTSLQALSPSGRSRPFHREADGLLPAEGAAAVVLMRLSDAVETAKPILGVIRGIGLSNDGRSRGFLVPEASAQETAMRAAYARAGLSPRDVSLIECHATGTAVGDAEEILAMNRVFADADDLPIGSHKSNIGHSITASGMAGLLKVLGAMEAEVRPPTLHVNDPLSAFEDGPLRPLTTAEPWQTPKPRRAGLSSFGFGGNNAHLIVEEYRPETKWPKRGSKLTPRVPVAIVGFGASFGDCAGGPEFVRRLLDTGADDSAKRAETVEIPLDKAKFPPADLKKALPQQTMMLAAAMEAVSNFEPHADKRWGTIVGMGCDPEISRHGLRWRLAEWAEKWHAAGFGTDAEWTAAARDAVIEPLDAARVVGTMPNIVANRLNRQFEWHGFGYTVSGEELSGLIAFRAAVRALQEDEIDVAVVGAVDVCGTPVHAAAAATINDAAPGDVAVALVVKRLDDAERDGDPILAVVEADDAEADQELAMSADSAVTRRFGHVHAASGLLHLAAGMFACVGRVRIANAAPWLPSPTGRRARIVAQSFGGRRDTLVLRDHRNRSGGIAMSDSIPHIRFFSGPDRSRLQEGDGHGPARMAVVAPDFDTLQERVDAAIQGATGIDGVWFRDAPIGGETAFAFTGAAAAYAGMGRNLLLAIPELADAVTDRLGSIAAAASWVYADPSPNAVAPFDQLKGCTVLAQIHAELTRGLLEIRPDAVLGLSSGETNGIIAMGAWRDGDALFADIAASGMYDRELTGKCRAWPLADRAEWRNWRILAPVDAVRDAIAGEENVRVTIVNTADDVVIGGEAGACRRVVERVGTERCLPLGHDMIVHCPELEPFAETWHCIHARETHAVPGVRFYANATGATYVPDRDTVAEMLTGQARRTVDFPRTVEAAWRDGVRVFIEHGPRGTLTTAIDRILGEREHVAVALDRTRGSGLNPLFEAVGRLFVAGVPMHIGAFVDRLEAARPKPKSTAARTMRLAVHRAPVRFPPVTGAPGTVMDAPPHLPPVGFRVPMAPLQPGNAVTVMTAPPRFRNLAPRSEPVPTTIHAASAARRFLARVAELHGAFLEEQGAMHRKFIDLMQQSASTPNPDQGRAGSRVVDLIQQSAGTPNPMETAAPAPAPAVVFDRDALERLASGRISSTFGPSFERQDGFAKQVRMPEPPLLLVDRVTALEGEPGSMGLGTIRTETDVGEDAWYLHHGAMPPGLMIESGQADLLLISWLGVDFLNRGERAYRLLGCELTFHGGLPKPGDTLCYDIHVDSHANQGDVRLFFFHYDCRIGDEIRLSVRNGQAGFFTDAELANSGGVLWDAADDIPRADARLDIPERVSQERRFDVARLDAFVRGDAFACFGSGFELAAAHQRTPTLPEGRLRLIDEVTEFDARGGPWKRGYLRAEARVPPDSWFYDGHFKNDPCMPGTLMAEAAVQAMSVHMAALGLTIDRDGWRFEPASGETAKFVCRGQVIPDRAHHLVYEVFVEEVVVGRQPMMRAALLCTADGLKVFFCRSFALSLVPDWPLFTRPGAIPADVVPYVVSPEGDVRGDFGAVLACAWGPPSWAFGSMYSPFDGGRKVPRLPGPPYLCISRIVDVDCPPGRPTEGARLAAEFDVDPDAWYFRDNPSGVMPYCVLLEAILQPCGWLGSYMGFAMAGDEDTCFRNLDGNDALMTAEVGRDAGTLRVEVTATSSARAGDMSLVFYDVQSFVGDRPVLRLRTSFGFFKISALRNQAGLSANDAQRAWLAKPTETVFEPDWSRVADGRLRMVDAVTGLWTDAGEAGLGRIRGRQTVDPRAWYFKAHFFQDPVQAGSLGIEALLQLLKCFMMATGLDDGIVHPRFEPAALDVTACWRYRGQVLPTAREVVTELEITRVEHEETGVLAVAKGSVWVGGTRIYEVEDLGMRVAAGRAPTYIDVDVEHMPWLVDHCPTHTVPTLPMTAAIDILVAAVAEREPGRKVIGVVDATALRWMVPPARLRTDVQSAGPDRWKVELSDDHGPTMRGTVIVADTYPPQPETLSPLVDPVPVDDPYASGAMFHGPSFQVASDLLRNGDGATFGLDGNPGSVPVGRTHPALLDGVFHAVPQDGLDVWFPEAPHDRIGYPHRIERLTLYGPTPTEGRITGEVRAERRKGSERAPVLRAQILADGRVWADMTVIEVLMPKGPLGMAPPLDRRRFLGERDFVPGVSLSSADGTATRLRITDVQASAWLPGTLEHVYDDATPRGIAIREHVARAAMVHPGRVIVDGETIRTEFQPLTRYPVRIEEDSESVRVTDAGPPVMDIAPVRDFWRRRLNCGPWAGEAVVMPLIERFVRRVVIDDPVAFGAVAGTPILFVGNHQTGIESLLFSIVAATLGGRPVVTIAKNEHRATWLGRLIALIEDYPGVALPRLIAYFDRADPSSMIPMLADLKRDVADNGASLMIHTEGTRSVHCRRPVERLSAVFTDLGMTVVPVRFMGGLPVPGEGIGERLEFPVGFGCQDILIGAPISAVELADLPLDRRRQRVLEGMNRLGPDLATETPHSPDPAFADSVARLMRQRRIGEPQAVVLHVMNEPDKDGPIGDTPKEQWRQRLFDWIRS